jgi:hypothetical protein
MVVENSLHDRLRQQQALILNDWRRRLAEGPSKEAAAFVVSQTDRFANPVAHAFQEATVAIYQALVDGGDVNRNVLEYAMKIKAVQGSDAVEGVAFIYLLKDIFRKMPVLFVSDNERMCLESRIDAIAAIASEMFIASRCKIAELAENSVRPNLRRLSQKPARPEGPEANRSFGSRAF